MTEKAEDLWPADLGIAPIVTPAAILREQAALLGEKTKGVLEGTVETLAIGVDVRHRFVILAPALGYYRYVLFQVHHSSITLYPVFVDEEPAMPQRALSSDFSLVERLNEASGLPSEEALRAWLRQTLASDVTTHIIRNLHAQASGQ
jgi:hypothetical protein